MKHLMATTHQSNLEKALLTWCQMNTKPYPGVDVKYKQMKHRIYYKLRIDENLQLISFFLGILQLHGQMD